MSPLLGAFALGGVTYGVDTLLIGPGHLAEVFSARVAFVFAVGVAVVAGAFLAGAIADAVEFLEQDRATDAADACLRWGLAFSLLYILGPLADFGEAVRHPVYEYVVMLHFHLAGGIASVSVLAWGIRLAISARAAGAAARP